ncbi:zinc-binding alcohol dehydrogenase family protein [Croceibacterium sp. LX-88]|uniref:Zinc-type alcohol dehydrogenase-like protein n=1 Tax=Croceibacterium selenioxidans TaxID=2838833 RepID=A0ABS5W419_9SPHN|nr:zinc-binding alcohol dehydrogenase family protein [Croceibacterium selenioxidans]MBT2134493.1 zinc-binding alcohol dehydrogenase family protein [Croceibacterium selenioxidans]
MRAIGLFKPLPADNPMSLVELDIPDPKPGPNDLLVRIEAISVNPADYRMRNRKADDGTFTVLGWDATGEVVGMGADVPGFALGDAVYYAGDLSRPGANSELHLVDSAIVARRPVSLSASDAVSLPLTALTAWEILFERFGLCPGLSSGPLTILIVGGAGGVGSIAIQLARMVPDLTVIATASRPASRAWCERLGAHAVIDHFADMGAQLAGQGLPRPNLVLLLNNPDRHYPAMANLLEAQGRICSVVPFDTAPDLNLLMRKSASFLWEFMFTRPMFSTPDKARQGEILKKVATFVDEGKLAPTASANLGPITAENLRTAHARLESGRTLGKLVLSGFPSPTRKENYP